MSYGTERSGTVFYFKMQKSSLKHIPWDDANLQLQGHVVLLALVYLSDRDSKTQEESTSFYIEYLLLVCHMLNPVLDTYGEFRRCYLKDHVEETIFTSKCTNHWRTLNFSC